MCCAWLFVQVRIEERGLCWRKNKKNKNKNEKIKTKQMEDGWMFMCHGQKLGQDKNAGEGGKNGVKGNSRMKTIQKKVGRRMGTVLSKDEDRRERVPE